MVLENSFIHVYDRVPRNLENENGHGKVMEKSWSMKNWPKVMEFCYQSWNLQFLPLKCTNFVMFFATTKKLLIDVESLHFLKFPQNCECKIAKRNVHGKFMEKYFVKSVGTLI